MLSIIVVGPKENATAWMEVSGSSRNMEGLRTYIPKAAAVPFVVVAQFTRHIERKTPAPQSTTTRNFGQFGFSSQPNRDTD